MDFPPTRAAAQDHISEIRRDKGLDGPKNNTADLERALILLSKELYQKSTHFLLELIQNADDNSFIEHSPALKISYENRRLLISCNEAGFERKNVEAICRIGLSTKTVKDQEVRYIGEKGIGFKSVFKVADVVWIKSGPYSFKFDKEETLGMIAPMWAEFPANAPDHGSSILLQLSPKYDVRELLQEIKSFDPRLLIFLHKLKEIHITAKEDHKHFWERVLRRSDQCDSDVSHQRMTLEQDGRSFSYIVTKYPVLNMPEDPKRSGQAQSEIMLAFPVTDHGLPDISSQQVYGFLPIRDYGFKFLLQSDFLLPVSREDIDGSSAWNRALLNSIPVAILEAVHILNKGELRYSWLQYFKPRPAISDFFGAVEEEVANLLSRSTVLESLPEALARPNLLTYIPLDFCDEKGLPLTMGEATQDGYLSRKYHEEDFPLLRRLGVKKMDIQTFLQHLQICLSMGDNFMKSKGARWHSVLAQRLMTVMARNRGSLPLLKELRIVPLQDGRWVSANTENLLFSSSKCGPSIPPGIDVTEVHLDARDDQHRYHLLAMLGVKTFDADRICEIIATTHCNPLFNPASLEPSILIAQATFVFHASWSDALDRQLWFVGEDGKRDRADGLYVHSEAPFAASGMPRDFKDKINFLHPGYLDSLDKKFHADWVRWVINNQSANYLPRLVTPSRASPFSMSKEFQHLIKTLSPLKILELLKTNWLFYRTWLEKRPDQDRNKTWELSRSLLNEEFASLEIRCRNGVVTKLRDTVLPTKYFYDNDLVAGQLPFLEVPAPDDPDWEFLKHFGVGTTDLARIFLKHLQSIAGTKPSVEHMSQLYQQLSIHAKRDGSIEAIRQAFSQNDLLYAPLIIGGTEKRWFSLTSCIWEGAQHLRKTPCLADYYPEHREFFRKVLQLTNIDFPTIIKEMHQITAYDDLQYISGLFIAISHYLEMDPRALNVDKIDDLRRRQIFPVDNHSYDSTFDPLHSHTSHANSLHTAASHDRWFIADRGYLRRSFEGEISLLSFRVEDIAEMGPLFKALSLGDRLLSIIARGVASVKGSVTAHTEYTNKLRKKIKFIASLMSKTNMTRYAEIIQDLKSLEVYVAEKVVVEWSVKLPGNETKTGRVDSGRVKIAVDSGSLSIYLTKTDLESVCPPPELGEELAKICGIEGFDKLILLHQILTRSNMDEIEETLERKGFIVSDIGDKPETKVVKERKENPEVDNTMMGVSRRTKPREHLSQPLASFIKDLEGARSVEKIMSRRWEQHREGALKPIMSRICKLEDQDASILLPRDSSSFFEKNGVPSFEDGVQCQFLRKPALIEDDLSDATVKYPAVYYSTGKGHHVRVYGNEANHVDQEMSFLGELAVSRLFEKYMGTTYSSTRHWTSGLRSRAGHLPYRPPTLETSTFTIWDTASEFSKFLQSHGYKKEMRWSSRPTFHIQVVTTFAGIHDEILLDGVQMTKAHDLHVAAKKTGEALDVFVLIVVSNISKDPQIAIFVDPWSLVIRDQLQLSNLAHYMASFANTAPYIQLPESTLELASNEVRTGHKLAKLLKGQSHTRQGSRDTSTEPYRYKQLPRFREFRLLELKPNVGNAPLEGTVRHYSMDSLPDTGYRSLSYQWGSDLKPYEVRTPEGPIPITSSLYHALLRIREPEKATLLWADAVCINQNDTYEKASQIRLMTKLYESAQSVCAWVGNARDQSDEAMETLLQIRTFAVSPPSWPTTLKPIPTTWLGRKVPQDNDSIWEAIEALLARGWFRRAWIVQEVVLAKKIVLYCGDWSANWDDIFEALKTCFTESKRFSGTKGTKNDKSKSNFAAYVLGLTREPYQHRFLTKRYDLLTLLELFSHTQSSLEIDKLFSLLALASDTQDANFDPDYESSLETVIRRYAEVFVGRGDTAKLLHRAGTSKAYSFCSWIPNWTGEEHPSTISTWSGQRGHFSASGKTPLHCKVISGSPNALSVRGVFIDSITSLGSITLKDHDIISYLNSIYQAIEALPPYHTGETTEELKLRLPIGSASRPHLDSTNDIETISKMMLEIPRGADGNETDGNFAGALSITSIRMMLEFLQQPREEKDSTWKHWHTAASFARRLSNARFLTTLRGYAGLAPGDTELGDRIFLAHGTAVPLMMRQKDINQYTLVGECYVHGIMYGGGLSFKYIKEEDIQII